MWTLQHVLVKLLLSLSVDAAPRDDAAQVSPMIKFHKNEHYGIFTLEKHNYFRNFFILQPTHV